MSAAKWTLLVSLGWFLAGCDQGPAEQTGEAVDDAVDQAAEAVEDATDAITETTE